MVRGPRETGAGPAAPTRRELVYYAALIATGVGDAASDGRDSWVDQFPSVTQTASLDEFRASKARVLLCNVAADPTWGPYAQRLSWLDTRRTAREARDAGARILTYIEGFGDCMLYAVALIVRPDGSFEPREDDPRVARAVRTHWCWGAPELPSGNAFRWTGPQSAAMSEDFTRPAFTLEASGVPGPRYPDGRSAIGRIPGRPIPLDAELWDASAAKDLNGALRPIFAPAIGVKPGDRTRDAITDGLYAAVSGRDDIEGARLPDGTIAYCGAISVHKDLSAPFWRDYARASARTIARAGLDGVWCDNWSPWDNFGYPPILHAFGEWSLHRFREYLARGAPRKLVSATGFASASRDIRVALKDRARSLGVANPEDLSSPGWHDRRWLDEPAWRLFKAGRQIQARRDLRAFHRALHAGAREGGRRDFVVCGNDIPMYGLGWARDEWTDMVHTEVTPGWHMGAGTRGIMLPPAGKMAVVYQAARAHQKARFCAAWYYLDQAAVSLQRRAGLGRTLACEAFANGAFILCDPRQSRVAGTPESHAWWNTFVRSNEEAFGSRRMVAEVGLVFSPDCQLWELAPGGFPDMDVQPHVFGHWGWGTALLDSHIPYVVLPDWKLTRSAIEGLRTLVLPDVVCLSEAAQRAITRWVRAGGRLIVSGPCGARAGVEGAFEPRARDLCSCLGVGETGGNAMLIGRGSVVRLPEGVGMRYYLRHEDRCYLRRSLVGPIEGLNPMLRTDAPTTIETVVWKPDRQAALDIDLANTDIDLASDRLRAAGPIRMTLRAPWRGPTEVRTLSPDAVPPAEVRRSGGALEISLDRLVHYASIRVAPV